jgi:very-short-patch-repair endonuclease
MHRSARFCVRPSYRVAHSRIMPPVTYARLLENGWTRHAIHDAVARGLLRRVARGWYDAGGCSADELTAAAAGGRLGCLTGLRDQGVWVPPTTHPDIISPRWSPPCGSGVPHALPRGAAWSGSAITYDVVECLRQVLRYHGVETALIVLESACNLGLVSERTVAELIAECPAHQARQLARFDPRSESGSETRVRLFLVRRGYKVRPQAVIPGVGRVDLLVGESLIIECDSHAHHTGETNYRGDRRRDLSATADAYRVVRLTWEQIFLTWPTTTSLLLTHLHTRRYLRPPSVR